jgi:hypothetical protein
MASRIDLGFIDCFFPSIPLQGSIDCVYLNLKCDAIILLMCVLN